LSTHNTPTPVLEVLSICRIYSLNNIVAGAYFNFELSYLITGLLLIFIVGADDLLGGTHKKLIGQTLAILIICIWPIFE
jgi:hypothetical protein